MLYNSIYKTFCKRQTIGAEDKAVVQWTEPVPPKSHVEALTPSVTVKSPQHVPGPVLCAGSHSGDGALAKHHTVIGGATIGQVRGLGRTVEAGGPARLGEAVREDFPEPMTLGQLPE